jgi:hypothetical protein
MALRITAFSGWQQPDSVTQYPALDLRLSSRLHPDKVISQTRSVWTGNRTGVQISHLYLVSWRQHEALFSKVTAGTSVNLPILPDK